MFPPCVAALAPPGDLAISGTAQIGFERAYLARHQCGVAAPISNVLTIILYTHAFAEKENARSIFGQVYRIIGGMLL